MKKRLLGRSGIEVTPLGFGSQTVGGLGYGDQNWDESLATVQAYLGSGGRFIDSARGYGVSEIYVGRALKKFRGRKGVVVSSKSGNFHPPIIRADMEVSRFCLQRDVIDIYYVHVPPKTFDELRRLLDVYEQFKQEGKIRLIGVSQPRLQSSEEMDQAWKSFEDGRIDVMQFPYSFGRINVKPLLAEARKRGIGVVVRQALEGGMFTDKFRPGHKFTDRANDWRAGIDPQAMEMALGRIEEIRRQFVKPPYTTLTQLALSYALHNPDVTATIPGAGSPAEMIDNMSAEKLPPMPDLMAKDLETAAEGVLELMRKKG